MTKLTILRGVSGSGKSTWAEAQFGNPVVVSRDKMRVSFYGSDGEDYYKVSKEVLHKREDFITKVEHTAIAEALKAGLDVISDNTNVRPKYFKKIAAIGYRLGADVELKLFDVTLDEAIRRNGQRAALGGRNVPEKAIREQFEALKGTRNYFPERPYLPAPYTGTPGKPKAILVDIDGTLAHMRDHRGPFEWHNVGKDEPDFNVMQVIAWIREGMAAEYMGFHGERGKVILMSGRDRVCEQETRDWLTSWDFGAFDGLFMRPQGDMRPDNIVKAELFDQHIRDNYDVVMVFDDRNQVVDMWRSMGVQVAQVAEGDF
jgi:predicted kinase